MQRPLPLLWLCLAMALFSCTKEEFISGNKPLPDQTIEDAAISSYISHTYISVLGRKPTTVEQSWSFNLLRGSNMTSASRKQFLDSIFVKNEYRDHLYTLARIDLLGNMDTALIPQQMALDSLALKDPTLVLYYDILRADLEKLDSMRQIPADLYKNKLHISNLHSRCANNYFYDQINMGTENFVVSCFQHFLNRYPSAYELSQSKIMVDGVPAILFLQSGQSKKEFLSIFFTSIDYYEGLVTNLYNRFLYRKPSSTEMGTATQKFQKTLNYEDMQKDILITDEYAGIK